MRGIHSNLTTAAFAVVVCISSVDATLCRNLPVDEGWPSKLAWNTFNDTVGGRLIETVPLGSVCHDPNYDEAACQTLRAQWRNGNTQ